MLFIVYESTENFAWSITVLIHKIPSSAIDVTIHLNRKKMWFHKFMLPLLQKKVLLWMLQIVLFLK
jgi:hypothetical protein